MELQEYEIDGAGRSASTVTAWGPLQTHSPAKLGENYVRKEKKTFEFSGNGSKDIQEMKKHIFMKIYYTLVKKQTNSGSLWYKSRCPLFFPLPAQWHWESTPDSTAKNTGLGSPQIPEGCLPGRAGHRISYPASSYLLLKLHSIWVQTPFRVLHHWENLRP